MIQSTKLEKCAMHLCTPTSAEPEAAGERRRNPRNRPAPLTTGPKTNHGGASWAKLILLSALFGLAAGRPQGGAAVAGQVIEAVPKIGEFLGNAIESRKFCFDQIMERHPERGICTTSATTCACPPKASQACGTFKALNLCCERDSSDGYCKKKITGTTSCMKNVFGHCYTFARDEWEDDGATCTLLTAGCSGGAPCNCYRGKRDVRNLYCTPKPGKDCKASWDDLQPNETAGAVGSQCSGNKDCGSLCCSCHFKKCASVSLPGHCCWYGSCEGTCPVSKELW